MSPKASNEIGAAADREAHRDSFRAEELPRPENMRRGWRLFVIGFFVVFLRIFKPYRLKGLENRLTEGPAVMLGNHRSYLEILVISITSLLWPHWVGKAELMDAPFPVPQVAKGWGMLPLRRDGSDLQTAKHMIEYIRDGRSLAIFPQGTRCRTLAEIKANLPKTGVFSLAKKRGLLIQPISTGGEKGIFKPFNVHYLEPIDPKTYRLDLPSDEARVWAIFETLYRDQGYAEAADFFKDKIAEVL